MKPDFLIPTSESFWTDFTLQQRIRAALTLRERASERFYGVSFELEGEGHLGLQEPGSEPLCLRVWHFLQNAADDIWLEMDREAGS